MKILTYVNGIITVINNDNYFNGVADKPSFITGETFYYEPTLSIMDDVNLTEELIRLAIDFIEKYDFSLNNNTNNIIEEVKNKEEDYVDIYGNYYFTSLPQDNYIKIDKKPSLENFQIWDFENNSFYDALIISKTTHKVTNNFIINESNCNDFIYIYYSNYNKEICSECQIYNLQTKLFEIDLTILKKNKINSLNKKCFDEIIFNSNEFGVATNTIPNSWLRQEIEARDYIIDNNTSTPFIDNILIGRNETLTKYNKPLETKDELINKIISKSNLYPSFYGKYIGKLTILSNIILESENVEEIKALEW